MAPKYYRLKLKIFVQSVTMIAYTVADRIKQYETYSI